MEGDGKNVGSLRTRNSWVANSLLCHVDLPTNHNHDCALIGLIVGKFLNCFAIGHESEGKAVGQVHKGIVMYDHLPSDCDAPPSSERSLQNEA